MDTHHSFNTDLNENLSHQAQRNIRLLYGFSFFWMFLLIIPVIVPFLLRHQLSMQQVFWLQVAFGATVMLFEVPSGYLSDLWGRKKTLVLGAVLNGLGYSWLALSDSMFDFLIFEMILGVAMSMASGTDMALLYGWLKHQDSSRESSAQAMATRQLVSVGAEAVASLLAGLLILWSFGVLLWAQALVAWLPLLISLRLQEAPYEAMDTHSHRDNFRRVLRHLLADDPLLRLILLNTTAWSLATFVAVWTFQKYWQELGVPLLWFGAIWAVYNLTVGLVGKLVPQLEKRWGSITLLLALSLLTLLGFWGMALATGFWGIVLGLSFQVSRGITQVQLREAINWRTPTAFLATANSFASLAFRLGFALLGPLMGWLIDHSSLRSALAVMGALFALAFVVLMLPLIRQVSQLSEAQAIGSPEAEVVEPDPL